MEQQRRHQLWVVEIAPKKSLHDLDDSVIAKRERGLCMVDMLYLGENEQREIYMLLISTICQKQWEQLLIERLAGGH